MKNGTTYKKKARERDQRIKREEKAERKKHRRNRPSHYNTQDEIQNETQPATDEINEVEKGEQHGPHIS